MNFNSIISYLTSNWRTLEETSDISKVIKLKPPQDLWFNDDYRFSVFKEAWKDYYEELFVYYVNSIAEFYDTQKDELYNIVKENATIFSTRIIDETTTNGNIWFEYLHHYIGCIRNTLLNVAKNTISSISKWGNDSGKILSNKYVNECMFLQTEVWSFISKISLPTNVMLDNGNLFKREIKSEVINKNFLWLMDFVNQSFFSEEAKSIEEIIAIWDNYLDINYLQTLANLKGLYKRSISKKLEFSFRDGNSHEITLIQPATITEEKVQWFSEVLDKAEKEIRKIPIECSWLVFLLKSKNPSSDENQIEIYGTDYWDNTIIAISLNSEDYQKALIAHESKKKIKIKGTWLQYKSKITITNLETINVDTI